MDSVWATLKGGLKALVAEGFIFISTGTMEMRTYSGFRASYRHFLDRNDFEAKGLNLYQFHHTYASMLLEQEITPKIVQKLLAGIYTPKMNAAQIRDELRQLDPLLSEDVEFKVRYS